MWYFERAAIFVCDINLDAKDGVIGVCLVTSCSCPGASSRSKVLFPSWAGLVRPGQAGELGAGRGDYRQHRLITIQHFLKTFYEKSV